MRGENLFKSGSVLATLLIFTTSAQAVLIGFASITNNNVIDAAIGETQLFMDVTDPDPGEVLFTFINTGPENCSITDIYFDDGHLLGISLIDDSLIGVSFAQPATPANLPGGDNLNPPFVATQGFSTDADSPPVANGVNPGEWLGITFDLKESATFANVLDDLETGALRVGLHVQGFDGGGSESFVNVPAPEPSTVVLLVAGSLALLKGRGRHSIA